MYVFPYACHVCGVYAFVFYNSFVSLITHELRFNQRVCAHVHLPPGGDGGVSIGHPSPLNYSSFSLFNQRQHFVRNESNALSDPFFSLAVEGFFFLMIFIVLFFFLRVQSTSFVVDARARVTNLIQEG